MSRVMVTGNRRLTARARGQSLPLIGMMIVVLVGMVGLSVDVGNTFQTERRAVAASNAAALAGMNVYIRRTSSTTNQAVFNAIVNTLNSNGVQVTAPGAEPQPGELRLNAIYLNSQGEPIDTGSPVISNNTNTVPNNVAFVQVTLDGQVDTYFARVVGRNDLPIDATAHAGTCPNGEGIFPIGVDEKLLDSDRNKFKNPGDFDPIDGQPDNGWRTIDSGTFAGYTAIRMDVQDSAGPGGFSWLRWADKKGATGTSANSAVELEASLQLPGNATALFEEADWPDSDVPEDYPGDPGILTVGDWVHGSTGYVSKMDDIMDLHVQQGTRMKLPIYKTVQGKGANAIYQISDIGVFVVLSHGQTKGTKYIEFVYLGNDINQESACSYSAAPTPGQTTTLFGEVSIRPEYAAVPRERRPIQYLVVLDVSGSMSANFDGQCDRGPNGAKLPAGRNYWQCANGPAGAPGTEVSGTGPDYYWNNEGERRITVAKQAIESLARSTNMSGNSGYDTTRPDDQMAVVWFTQSVDRDGTGNITSFGSSNFSNQVGDENSGLIRAINRAGWRNNNPYRTEGGTNGAAGLYRASLAFDRAPKTVTDPNGKTWEYKRVVIFITDGVSNQFLDKNRTNLLAGQSGSNTYANGHFCRTVANVVEVVTCQVTGNGATGGGLSSGGGGVPAGLDRPITQAGLVSKEDLQPKGVLVYAISLSNIPDTGLKDTIASFPSYYFPASNLQVVNGKTNVDSIMEKINTEVESGLCTPRSDVMDGKPEWRGDIPPQHFQSVGGLTYPNVGEVILKNIEDDTTFTIPIIADSSGRLSYRKTDVPVGTYQLTPYLWYRHPLDPPTALPRQYGTILEADQRLPNIIVRINTDTATTGTFNPQVQQDLKLVLNGNVCTQ